MAEQKKSWWDSINWVGGDNIQVSIGDHATNVVAGKNIAQAVRDAFGESADADNKEVQEELSKLKQAIQNSNLSMTLRAVAEYNANLLEQELTKPEETPEPGVIQQAGNWLFDNLPDIAEAVISLFASPAVVKVLAKAGDGVLKWVRTRFGPPRVKPLVIRRAYLSA